MTAEELPRFRYYPDPVGGGSVEESAAVCGCCGRARGWIAAAAVYVDGTPRRVCPWCIADGSAELLWDAHFNGIHVPDGEPQAVIVVAPDGTAAAAGPAAPDGLPAPPGVLHEIARRTPSFQAWQEPEWMFHCGDACAFLGEVWGAALLEEGDEGKIAAVLAALEEVGGWERGDLDGIGPGGQPAVYLFRCLRCGAHTAYCDYT